MARDRGPERAELAYVYGGFSRGNPVPLLVPLLLVPAGWQAWRVRRDRASQVVLAVGLTAIVVSLGFLVLPRYLLGFTAVLAVFAAWGLVELHDRAHGWRRPALTAAVATVLVLAVLQGVVRPDAPGGTNDPTEQVAAGRWIAANTAPGSRIMTRSFAVQHYGERPVVALPAGTYDEVLDYARANGVRYLVADERTIRDRRPELAGPLLDGEPHPGLREVADLDEERGRVVIYALDPPPPESDRPTTPPGLHRRLNLRRRAAGEHEAHRRGRRGSARGTAPRAPSSGGRSDLLGRPTQWARPRGRFHHERSRRQAAQRATRFGTSGSEPTIRPRAGRGRRCRRTGGAASTWPAPRSGGCARG